MCTSLPLSYLRRQRLNSGAAGRRGVRGLTQRSPAKHRFLQGRFHHSKNFHVISRRDSCSTPVKPTKMKKKTRIKPNISPALIAMVLFCAVAVLAPTSTITITKTKSPAFAVLRPLFPVRPAPPFSGEVIAIGDDLIVGSAKEHQLKYRGEKRSRL
jgi:hypothetical protein